MSGRIVDLLAGISSWQLQLHLQVFFSLLYQASNFSVVYYVAWPLSLHAWIYTHVDLSLTPGAKCLRSGFLSAGILVLLRLLRKDFPERFVRRWGRRLGQAKEVSRELASAEAYYSMISREALELNGSIRFPTLRWEICAFEFPVLFSHWSWATRHGQHFQRRCSH